MRYRSVVSGLVLASALTTLAACGAAQSPPPVTGDTRPDTARVTVVRAHTATVYDHTFTAIDALRAHRQRQLSERLSIGPAWTDLDLVFPTAVGTPLDGTQLLRRGLHPLLRRAG